MAYLFWKTTWQVSQKVKHRVTVTYQLDLMYRPKKIESIQLKKLVPE